jgi:hypothetical protein
MTETHPMASSHPITPPPELEGKNCPGCEGTPAAENSPCAVCGRLAIKPPSLKEQALAILNDAHRGDLGDDEMATIRRALEALPND